MVLFYSSYLFVGKIRSIGVSNLPVAIRLLIGKGNSRSIKFTSTTTKSKVTDHSNSKNDDKDDKSNSPPYQPDPLPEVMSWDELCHKVWACLQASSVISGLLNIYPHVIIKWNAMFHIVLIVKESMEHRFATQTEQERIAKEQEEKRQRILDFWHRWLPNFLYEWIFMRKEKQNEKKLKDEDEGATTTTSKNTTTTFVSSSTSEQSSSVAGLRQRNTTTPTASTKPSSSYNSLPSNEEIRQHVSKAKRVVQGHRESVLDDMIWGGLQIVFIYNEWTNWQTFVIAWLAFLLTILEEAILDTTLSCKQKWRKILWIGAAAVGTGKLAFF